MTSENSFHPESIVFKGQTIPVVVDDKGIEYVAIKPICTALDLHYKAQHERISQDGILSQLSSIHGTTGADGKTYDMVCLPVIFVFAWLFSVRSTSEIFNQYKLECIWVLYDHFYGRAKFELQKRVEALEVAQQISAIDNELRSRKAELRQQLLEIESRDWDKYKEKQKQLFLFNPVDFDN